MIEKQTLLINEVANILRVSKAKVYEMVRKGELPSVNIGRAKRIPADMFDEWMQKNSATNQ